MSRGLTLSVALGALFSLWLAHALPACAAIRRAPSGPPLTAGAAQNEAEASTGAPSGAGRAADDNDPLVNNGLSSPLCDGSMSADLSVAAKTNCQTSDFVAAPAPTGNYGIDVNIDVGPFGLGNGTLLSIVQDLFVTPIWSGLVWTVHALLVMVEWCYTLDLLSSPTMSGIAHGLRAAQAAFTQPWLALVLAAASVLALYNGLVRRRVAETLGQALLTIAMMVCGLWVIADPMGTVGVLGGWAEQASLGTLATVVEGTPAHAPRTLADSIRALFASTVQAPWCYLEFGDVRWCDAPALLDPRLRKAAMRIQTAQQAMIGCKPNVLGPLCVTPGSAAALSLEHSDRLLENATTNGELFLAFPANGVARNSFKEGGSLLHVMCQSEKATSCTGSAAAQAAFRSGGGTFPRMIGVLAIAFGALGTVLLLGFLALRLLGASVISLFLLLLAPVAVLAPALGDGGRSAFSGWATRLLGALTSKLLYSFLLGVLLVMQRTLTSLRPFGWWTQWLLLSAFWWGMFVKRHQALALIQTRRHPSLPNRRSGLPRRLGATFEAPVLALSSARWAREKVRSPLADSDRLRAREPTSRSSPLEPSEPYPIAQPEAHEVKESSPPAPPPTTRASERRSAVMDDAREVAEGRKRQLGYGPRS